MSEQAYDVFSNDYDRFVNWPARLAYELPFIITQIKSVADSVKILDAACGTGMHAIALKQKGFYVVGADISVGMIEKSRQNAAKVGVDIRFEPAGFGDLAHTFGENQYDVVLCLGNSLPHVLTTQLLETTIRDFYECLRPGGMLLIQNRNFNMVMEQNERWMEPQAYKDDASEWIFIRFYDFLSDGTIRFNIMTLKQIADTPWKQTVTSTYLHPWLEVQLRSVLSAKGFGGIHAYGDMTGIAYDHTSSGNLVITANKTRRPE